MSFCKLKLAPLVSSLSLFLFTSLFLSLFDDLPHSALSFIPPAPLNLAPVFLQSVHLPLAPPSSIPHSLSFTFFITLNSESFAPSLRALLQTPSSFLSLQIKILTLSLSLSLFVSPSFYVPCQSLAPPTPLLRLVF